MLELQLAHSNGVPPVQVERRQGTPDRRVSGWRPWFPERRRGLPDRRPSGRGPGQAERRRGLGDRRNRSLTPPPPLAPLSLQQSLLPLMSHELRTPLATVQGYAELLGRRLRKRGADDELLSPVGVISAETRRLGAVVDELLDLLELSYADVRPPSTRVDLATLVEQAAAAAQGRSRKHQVVEQVAPPVPVRGEAARLRQLVDHLLQNAMKYSPDGGEVEVRAWATDEHVFLAVADQGIGIAPEYLARVFEPFFQVEPVTSRSFGGLGLGLTLCRAITERHGGQIWAESTPGQGSTFYVRLPHADAHRPADA